MKDTVRPYLLISEEETARRKKEIDFARGSCRLEGIVLSEEQEALNARYINAELTSEQLSLESMKVIYGRLGRNYETELATRNE